MIEQVCDSRAQACWCDKYHFPSNDYGYRNLAHSKFILNAIFSEMYSQSSFSIYFRTQKWQSTPVFLPGKSHEWRSLVATVHGVAKSWTGLSNFTFTLRHTSATPHSILFILSTGFITFHCVPGILFPNWMTTP